MGINPSTMTILMAEDDSDDRLLAEEAVTDAAFPGELKFGGDGEELIDYLRRRGRFKGTASGPSLILRDLNMPRKAGHEALEAIKADPDLRTIPVVVLTTYRTERHIARSYSLGVNSYITKPTSFDSLINSARILVNYWLQTVRLPPGSSQSSQSSPAYCHSGLAA